MLGREAIGCQLGKEVDSDDRLSRAWPAADEERTLFRACLTVSDSPQDVIERHLLFIEKPIDRLSLDDSRGVVEQTLVWAIPPFKDLLKYGFAVPTRELDIEEVGELVHLVASEQGPTVEQRLVRLRPENR